MLWVLRVNIMSKLTENMGVIFYAQARVDFFFIMSNAGKYYE